MKLKYKKIVLLITTFTMLIGLVVLSIITPSGSTVGDGQAEQTQADTQDDKEDLTEGTNTEETDTEGQGTVAADSQNILLEKSTNEQINQLIVDYFEASVACDMDALGTLVSDVSILNQEELKIKYELVESVENIECYFAKGLPEGKYLVYVYSEVKFKDIATMAPGLSRLSVVETADGGYTIFFGADTEIEQFVELADVSAPVQELVEKVSVKMEEALSNDAALRSLNEKMTGGTQAGTAE